LRGFALIEKSVHNTSPCRPFDRRIRASPCAAAHGLIAVRKAIWIVRPMSSELKTTLRIDG
jgi:hypothetical protein